MTQGSPIWQGGLLLFAVLFLLFEVWRGWRAGLARAGINVAAVVVSAAVGYYVAKIAAAPFGGFTDPAGFVAGSVVGCGLGIFIFLVLWLSGIIFFKRTDHQGSGIFRLFWGLGGGTFGLIMGLLILWSGISVIRAVGALAEARVATDTRPVERATGHGTNPQAHTPVTAEAPPPAAPPSPLAANLLKLKESLELGPAGKFVESVDILPTDFYELVAETGKVGADQQAVMRFFEYPGLKSVLNHPKFAELINDPAVLQAGQDQNLAALLTNPKVRAAVQDPALAEELKKVDLRAALKFALEKPTPTPSPSPATKKPGSARN